MSAKTTRNEAIEICAEVCEYQGHSLADTLKNTKGSAASTLILKQQMASAYGCAWAIRRLLELTGDKEWEELRKKRAGQRQPLPKERYATRKNIPV
jgi:hypothetical protein